MMCLLVSSHLKSNSVGVFAYRLTT
jgi:hypothetical protein